MTNIIEPRILKGTRDFLPQDMAKRQYVMDKIVNVFKRFGYDTIETPVIEYAETLLGKYGEEGSKLMYQFPDNGGRQIALRYDQTVPTARFVAMYYNNLPMPFKRYQISRVWRADKPAKGRYREFYQCDIDIIGTDSLVADAEIAKVVSSVMQDLGFPEYIIKFNSRRLINSVLEGLAIQEYNYAKVLQTLDKLDKIGRPAVAEELANVLDASTVEKLLSTLVPENSADVFSQLAGYDTTEVERFIELCEELKIPKSNMQFDPSLARGLDYYTGIIYEVVLPNMQIGAVCGGGRYDDLCGMFTTKQLSGVGVAFGFDRLVLALEELGMLDALGLNSQVLVTYFDDSTLPQALAASTALQEAGINTEMYFEAVKLSKQFTYANAKRIPFVVVIGPDEAANDTVTIKIMATGKQKTIPSNQLTTYFRGLQTV